MNKKPKLGKPKSKKITILVVAIVTTAVIGVAIGWWILANPAAPVAQSTLFTVQADVQQSSVDAKGTFAPKTMKTLSFGQTGSVAAITVAQGQSVTAGQPLANLDPTQLKQQLLLAQANQNVAYENLVQAQTNLTSTSAQLANYNAQLVSAQTKTAQAQAAVDATTLTSPIDGVVAAVNFSVGDRIGAASQSSFAAVSQGGSSSAAGAGSTISGNSTAASSGQVSVQTPATNGTIVVVAPGEWIVNAMVNAVDIADIKPEMQAQMTATGSTEKIFGTVLSVGSMATTSGGTSTFPVVIKVTGKPSGVYIGGSVNVSIITKQLNEVLTVPTAAITTSNGKATVQKMINGKPVSTQVSLGQVFGNSTEIQSGLSEGDQISYTPRQRVANANANNGTRRPSNNAGFPGSGLSNNGSTDGRGAGQRGGGNQGGSGNNGGGR